MKKFLLRTGLITIGGFSIFANDLKLYAKESSYSIEQDNEDYLEDEELVEKYANIYHMNSKVIQEKFRSLTGNYQSILWRNSCMIDNTEYSNRELAILSTVRKIYFNPEEYGLTYEDIKSDKVYETDKCHEDLIWDYSNIIGVNKEVALAISLYECGPALDSYNYLSNHNPAGLGPFNYYLNTEEGIIEYLFILKNGYGIDEYSDSSVFSYMESSYCGDGSDWASPVSSMYYNACDNYYCYADWYGREHYNEEEVEKIIEKEKVLVR